MGTSHGTSHNTNYPISCLARFYRISRGMSWFNGVPTAPWDIPWSCGCHVGVDIPWAIPIVYVVQYCTMGYPKGHLIPHGSFYMPLSVPSDLLGNYHGIPVEYDPISYSIGCLMGYPAGHPMKILMGNSITYPNSLPNILWGVPLDVT